MKKPKVIYFLIATVFLAMIFYSVFIYKENNPYRPKQENLARELGVAIDDNTGARTFPSGYFHSVLNPGMTIEEVHKIMQGYEKVYHCKPISEVYYYFSLSDSKAIRFEIIYDERGNLEDFRGDDPSGYEIKLDGCTLGLISQ